jgi:hypothetical protein
MPAVRAIDRAAARGNPPNNPRNNNHFSSFILGIVKSAPFQMRRAEETAPAATNLAAAGRAEHAVHN